MPRPRFAICPDDWFDTLGWLEFQLSRPEWLVQEFHPIHEIGLAEFTDRVRQLRQVVQPSHPDCDGLQDLLTSALERSDWDRLRKTLSARRRRRRERRLNQSPVNLTLTPHAHHWLKQLMQAGGHDTLSDALEAHLPDIVAELELRLQRHRYDVIEAELRAWSTSKLLVAIERYLTRAQQQRSLATACRIAYQWYQRDPDPTKESLMRERFIEDLVWNESHLKRPAHEFVTIDPVSG